MIIMNDDDENDNNERTTHPLASAIQGQPCQALKSTMGAHLCVCVCVLVCICLCVAIWLSLCHWFYLETLFIYLFIYLFMYSIIYLFQRFGHLSLSLAESRAALCGHFTVRWSGFVSVLHLCASALGRVMSKDHGRGFGFKMQQHLVFTHSFACTRMHKCLCMRTIVVISSRQRKAKGERVAPRSSPANTPVLAPIVSDCPA